MTEQNDVEFSEPKQSKRLIWLVAVAISAACALFLFKNFTAAPIEPDYPSTPEAISRATKFMVSDEKRFAEADIRLLFIGNSHTIFHDLHHLVGDLIRFRTPDKKIYTHSIGDRDLEFAQHNPAVASEINTRPWDAVILQGQPISQSGKYLYSKKGSLSLAKMAHAKGLRVMFYSEWGLRDDAKNTEHTAKIYNELATETSSELIPVGRVWARALQKSPELNLYEEDGNHQNRLGASLTALVIAATFLKNPSHDFHEYRDPVASPAEWKLFCDAAEILAASGN
ncbi:MAG: hypothetical protein ABL888_22565 [Pirellulaceae bacterium]